MKWQINYSRSANKFIEEHNSQNETRELLIKFLMRLEGDWEGYYRIRKQ